MLERIEALAFIWEADGVQWEPRARGGAGKGSESLGPSQLLFCRLQVPAYVTSFHVYTAAAAAIFCFCLGERLHVFHSQSHLT